MEMIKVPGHVINLGAIASAHWEKRTLFVHLIGGRFLSFKDRAADLVWQAVSTSATDLVTGEVSGGRGAANAAPAAHSSQISRV
jgi:hypothetical protein